MKRFFLSNFFFHCALAGDSLKALKNKNEIQQIFGENKKFVQIISQKKEDSDSAVFQFLLMPHASCTSKRRFHPNLFNFRVINAGPDRSETGVKTKRPMEFLD